MQQSKISFPAPAWLHLSPVVLLFFFCLSVVQSGCTSFNGSRLENILGANTNLIEFSYGIADRLTESAFPPLVPRHPDMPVLVTTLVDNNDLQRTTRFGRILQEHIASRFVQLGYTVKEIKMAKTVRIEPKSGETVLSRDLAQLSDQQQAQAILAGTFSRGNRTLYISARLINPANDNILASDDFQLYMDDDILALFGVQRGTDSDQPVEEPRQPVLNSILYLF